MEKANAVELFNLNNGEIEVVLCNYGCTIVAIYVAGKDGIKKNVVAGFGNPGHYKKDHPYFGSTVGRYANRIAGGKFTIDEQVYQLSLNNNGHHLHGGIDGFHKKIWKAEQDKKGITFLYLSKDGEEGYPGNLLVSVRFTLTGYNRLNIIYTAITDRSTILNLTNHSYFNLSGFESVTICDHMLKIYARTYTVKNENNIPSGEIKPVSSTPYDFTNPKSIGKDIDLLTEDFGFDLNYVLDKKTPAPALAAELYEPGSGRLLKVFTDQPGMQLYTANGWDGSFLDQQGRPFRQYGAVALETQALPDSPNHLNFPDTILRPGQVYNSKTTYQFLTV